MKKSVYALFLFVIICFLSCGCTLSVSTVSEEVLQTNAFRLLRQASNSGQIGMAYIFPVNSKELYAQGYTDKQVDAFRFYLTTYVNGLAKSNSLKATDGVIVGKCQYFSDVDGLGFVINFESLDAQKKYFGAEQGQGGGSQKETSGFFIKKSTLQTSFPFSKKSAGDFKMICLMAMSSWANDQNLTEQQLAKVKQILETSVFIYDFSTQQSGLCSELVYEDENFYHNVFIKTQNELDENNQIDFWTETPNYPVWYICALSFVLIAMLIAFLAVKKQKKKHK